MHTVDAEVLKQMQLLGFDDSPALRRAILQSEPKNPAVTMYHTILRNLRRAGMSQSTNSTSGSEYSITDSGACDSAESAGSERKVKAKSNSRDGQIHSKRKSSNGHESVGGSDSSEHAASTPSSPAPESAAKRRNLTQSMGGNPAAVMQAKVAKEAMARQSAHAHERKKSNEMPESLRRSYNPNGPAVPEPHEEPTTRRRGNTVVANSDFEDFVPRAVTSVDPELVKKMRRRSDKPVSKKREESQPEPQKDKDTKDKKDKKDKKAKVKKEKFEAVEEEITIADLPPKKEKKEDKKKDRRKSDSTSRHRGDVKKDAKANGGMFSFH